MEGSNRVTLFHVRVFSCEEEGTSVIQPSCRQKGGESAALAQLPNGSHFKLKKKCWLLGFLSFPLTPYVQEPLKRPRSQPMLFWVTWGVPPLSVDRIVSVKKGETVESNAWVWIPDLLFHSCVSLYTFLNHYSSFAPSVTGACPLGLWWGGREFVRAGTRMSVVPGSAWWIFCSSRLNAF